MIDGDSATVAELVALLSALAGLPVQQGIAITGSVNQHGEVQAVGGVNEKIEGFFDVCQQAGLSGQQGVAIPAANVRNVVLRPDVVAAVADERFRVWAIHHVDQALQLLCQQPAGDLDQEGTVHHAVASRLRTLAGILKDQGPGNQPSITTFVTATEPPADPRPPLPGSESE
jgi:predicted ATP-dependent protease